MARVDPVKERTVSSHTANDRCQRTFVCKSQLRTEDVSVMKIAKFPYHAKISPHKGGEDFLWFCVIRREGSTDVVARRDASTKEDACCVALLELTRLQDSNHAQRPLGSSYL